MAESIDGALDKPADAEPENDVIKGLHRSSSNPWLNSSRPTLQSRALAPGHLICLDELRFAEHGPLQFFKKGCQKAHCGAGPSPPSRKRRATAYRLATFP